MTNLDFNHFNIFNLSSWLLDPNAYLKLNNAYTIAKVNIKLGLRYIHIWNNNTIGDSKALKSNKNNFDSKSSKISKKIMIFNFWRKIDNKCTYNKIQLVIILRKINKTIKILTNINYNLSIKKQKLRYKT